MFIEPYFQGEKRGWIEIVTGSMFSGKTEELIRRLKRAAIANLSVKIFKPAIDTRYDALHIVSHDEHHVLSTPVDKASEIPAMASEANVIGIDEAQFFDDALPDIAATLALAGKRVIIAGLDMDYLGRPFGPVPALLAMADYVTKLHAVCVVCGNIALYSYRRDGSRDRVLIGEKEWYEPRCRVCYHLADGAQSPGR